MANRILIKGQEIDIPVSSGTASSITGASVVRLTNENTTNIRVVTVVAAPSGTIVGSFSILPRTVEYLEKNNAECIFSSDSDIKCVKVGFTN